jgi:enolase
MKAYGSRCLVVGDDLFGGRMERLEEGIRTGAANCTMLKVNMIGTLTDAFRYNVKARENGYAVIVSPRCGDTADPTPAHLGLAWRSNLIKTVGAVGGERVAKINEFVRITEGYTHGEVRMAPLPGLDIKK